MSLALLMQNTKVRKITVLLILRNKKQIYQFKPLHTSWDDLLHFHLVEPRGFYPKTFNTFSNWIWSENTLAARIGNLKSLR